jgi:hypothetical protein
MDTDYFPIKIRNFGNVPTRQSYVNASMLIAADMPGDAHWGSFPNQNDWDQYACQEALYFRIHSPGLGTQVFPPGEDEERVSASRDIPITAKAILAYAIVVCVAYEDATTGSVHRTAVAYCPYDIDIVKSDHREHVIDHTTGIDGYQRRYSADLWYTPAKQFKRCRADSD